MLLAGVAVRIAPIDLVASSLSPLLLAAAALDTVHTAYSRFHFTWLYEYE